MLPKYIHICFVTGNIYKGFEISQTLPVLPSRKVELQAGWNLEASLEFPVLWVND